MTGWSFWNDGNGDKQSREYYQVQVRELVDRAHVTRLTAERDGLLTQCAGIYQQLEICQKQRDHRQSELTKALELLMRLRNCKWIPTAEWQHEVSDVLARQSAPAANGVSDE